MGNSTFVNLSEIGNIVLEMMGSKEFSQAMETCDQTGDFRQGAIWGAAMAVVFITTKATTYHPTVMPSVRDVESIAAEGSVNG